MSSKETRNGFTHLDKMYVNVSHARALEGYNIIFTRSLDCSAIKTSLEKIINTAKTENTYYYSACVTSGSKR